MLGRKNAGCIDPGAQLVGLGDGLDLDAQAVAFDQRQRGRDRGVVRELDLYGGHVCWLKGVIQ
jgi:hypothetical protein